MSFAMRRALVVAGGFAALTLTPPRGAEAQTTDSLRAGYSAAQCPSCAEWNAPASPVRLHGNVYYVGTRGLSAILLTSDSGHVLIDAGLPESAEPIMAHIRALGFRVEDVKLIVNSHAHYDHAGGIAAIQRASGARVVASPSSAAVLRTGQAGRDDPQYGIALAFPAVTGTSVRVLADGDTLRVGPIALVAHFTPGHTPGGTSWSWHACEGAGCLDFVYADSQTPVSSDDFLFTRSTAYPTALRDFARGFEVLDQLRCDVLLTPHPSASRLWERIESRRLEDPQGCRRYVAGARAALARRVAAESGK
ncbi:MAG TPA: subclass B3 metallo-beta-lactamase [Gemmatimonadaceae bacterium]|nr:subclass B3 metallo-beta-lactamase [Gemmatimonadaceae bacterium]